MFKDDVLEYLSLGGVRDRRLDLHEDNQLRRFFKSLVRLAQDEDLADYRDDKMDLELGRRVWEKCTDADMKRIPFFQGTVIRRAVLHGVSSAVYSGSLCDVIEQDTKGTDFVVLPECMVSCCLRQETLNQIRSWISAGTCVKYNLTGKAVSTLDQCETKTFASRRFWSSLFQTRKPKYSENFADWPLPKSAILGFS